MKAPENVKNLLFGGAFVLANKLQYVGEQAVKGLPTKQWFLLHSIMDMPAEPPPAITQIAKEMDSTRQNVTQMLVVMERQGLVKLEKSTSDRRSRCVRITKAGLCRARESAQNAQPFLERLFGGLSPAECEAAGRVLVKMLENLEKMQEELAQSGREDLFSGHTREPEFCCAEPQNIAPRGKGNGHKNENS